VPPDGFYKPSPGMHQGDDDCDDAIRCRDKRRRDDCDETLKRNLPLKAIHTIWLNQLLNGPRVKRLF
jgi:hypothetical protein